MFIYVTRLRNRNWKPISENIWNHYFLASIAQIYAISICDYIGQFDLISRFPKAASSDRISLSLFLIVDCLVVCSDTCSRAHCPSFCSSLRLELTARELAK